jgi:hypothetical protein
VKRFSDALTMPGIQDEVPVGFMVKYKCGRCELEIKVVAFCAA